MIVFGLHLRCYTTDTWFCSLSYAVFVCGDYSIGNHYKGWYMVLMLTLNIYQVHALHVFRKSVWSVLWHAQEKFNNFFISFVMSVYVCIYRICFWLCNRTLDCQYIILERNTKVCGHIPILSKKQTSRSIIGAACSPTCVCLVWLAGYMWEWKMFQTTIT